jgi:hypothetical protein
LGVAVNGRFDFYRQQDYLTTINNLVIKRWWFDNFLSANIRIVYLSERDSNPNTHFAVAFFWIMRREKERGHVVLRNRRMCGLGSGA